MAITTTTPSGADATYKSQIGVIARDESEIVYVTKTRYGADPTGATASTQAFNDALEDSYNGIYGREIVIPHGNYLIDDDVIPNMDHQNGLSISGAGRYSTFIKFSPSAHDKTCFNISNTALAERAGGVSISNLTINSAHEDTFRKTAIYVEDASALTMNNVDIRGFHDPSQSSIGIRLAGREGCQFNTVIVNFADRPFVCSKNPNLEDIGVDSFNFMNCGFICHEGGTGLKAFEVEPGAIMYNPAFRNCNFILGKYGFYYEDTIATAGSNMFRFRDCRREQAEDATGYSVYVDADVDKFNGNIIFDGFNFDLSQNGLYVRNMNSVALHACNHATTASEVLNLDNVKALSISGFCTLGGQSLVTQTASLGDLKLVSSGPKAYAGNVVPNNAEYIDGSVAGSYVGDNAQSYSAGASLISPQNDATSDVTFAATGKTITTTGALNFTGILAGDAIYVDDTTTNDGMYVAAIDATATVITVTGTLTDQNPVNTEIVHGAILEVSRSTITNVVNTTVGTYLSTEAVGDMEQNVFVTTGKAGTIANAAESDNTIFDVVNVGSSSAPTADKITLTASTSPMRLWNNRTTNSSVAKCIVEQVYY